MTSDDRWRFPEKEGEDLSPIFRAAKQGHPQYVFDREGVFTLTYKKAGDAGSAQKFLLGGGADDE